MISTTKLQARCVLDVPLLGSREEARSIEPHVIAARWVVNSHLEADELHLTLDWSSAGIDVRTLKNAHVAFWLWDANLEDEPDRARFVGIVTDAERAIEAESSHVTLTAKDYTILFLSQKGLAPSYVPEYTMTLAQAWARICEGTGYLDRATGQIQSSVAELSSRIVFVNEADAARVIGEGVPWRIRNISKPQMMGHHNPWWLWTSITGAMGLHTFIDGDRVVVVRPSEFYDDTKAAVFVYGANLKSISERVETSKHAKGVCLVSFDPFTGAVREAFWPPPGSDTIRTSRPGTAKRTISEDYDVFQYGAVIEERELETRAREAYEERSRQELQGKLSTAETRAFRDDGSALSIFDLEPGGGIRVDWDLGDDEYVRGLDLRDRVLHYLGLGYASDVASFMAENIDRMAQAHFNRTHHIKSMAVDVDWQAAKFAVDVDYHNVIALE